MTNEIVFEVGGKYENVKGVYKVLSMDSENDAMVIQWENGEEIETSIKLQEKIIKRMMFEKKLEAEQSQTVKGYTVPNSAGSEFKGFVETDFKNNVTGTTWRSRNSLGGAVTRQLFSKKYTFISTSVYRVPMTQWADVQHRLSTADASEQGKFFVQANEKGLDVGFYIEHPKGADYSKNEWNEFINWLNEDENEKWVNKISEANGLTVKIDEWHDDKMVSAAYLKPENGTWKKDNEIIESITPFVGAINPEHWVGLYVYSEMVKESVVSQKKEIAVDIAGVFELLMPLYEASTKHSFESCR